MKTKTLLGERHRILGQSPSRLPSPAQRAGARLTLKPSPVNWAKQIIGPLAQSVFRRIGTLWRSTRSDKVETLVPLALLLVLSLFGNSANADGPDASRRVADRTTLYLPLASDHEPAPMQDSERLQNVLTPEVAIGDHAGDGWKAYLRLWKSHHGDPSDQQIRRFLGLGPTGDFESKVRRSRSAPRWLGWRAGSYSQVDTPHFVIYSQADPNEADRIAQDLERCYWVWTQLFFPLWEARQQVSLALADMNDDVSVADFLKNRSPRITIRRKLRIILFADSRQYAQTLGRDHPGIERSTGFYSGQKATMCLYASDVDDPQTRHHELVHQLFREATRSELGREMPGEQSGFWLIEGIAGYFESLVLFGDVATVGGWDASRLQYARYRILGNSDRMTLGELRSDGRLAAQKRADIARWYTHAIAKTHQMFDGGNANDRMWVYRQLAERYKIKTEPEFNIDLSSSSVEDERSVERFLAINDQHVTDNPPRRNLEKLCLTGCLISETGLQSIHPSANWQWLDLAGLPIGNESVKRLADDPGSIKQLSLEGTRVDSGLNPWLRRIPGLEELDLSRTAIDDTTIEAIAQARNLSVLWLTGSRVTDQSIPALKKFEALDSIDVQQTGITDAGVAQLRQAGIDEVNPLQVLEVVK